MRAGWPAKTAGLLKLSPWGGSKMALQDFIGELVGDFMKKDFPHRIPGVIQYQIQAQGDFRFSPGTSCPGDPENPTALKRGGRNLLLWVRAGPKGLFPIAGEFLAEGILSRLGGGKGI